MDSQQLQSHWSHRGGCHGIKTPQQAASAAFPGREGIGIWGRWGMVHAPVALWSILEDLGKARDAAVPGILLESGCPCPAPSVLGAEGISSSMFLPSILQKMQRAQAGPGFWVEEAKYELPDRWTFLPGRSWHLPTWQQQKSRDTAWPSWHMAWEIWGEHPQPPVMLCHFCPHCC